MYEKKTCPEMYPRFRYAPAGDSALVVEIGNGIKPEINEKIRSLLLAIEQRKIPGIRECVPTYCSLMILYDPAMLLFHELIEVIQELEGQLESAFLPEARVVEVPVLYGGGFGPDIAFVAEHTGLSETEVITRHSGRDYLVYMLGFTPGFCYLGGMSEDLNTPRLAEPRTKIPAGSVGIAGAQTGMYPIESPGGWQLIGRTPLKLFDPQRDPPVIINAGDSVRFLPINEREYERLTQRQEESANKNL